jgi:hypothetical protein
VSDAVEALRQDMDEEAADELVCCERHHLVAIGPGAERIATAPAPPAKCAK